jgi:hypothetical protein
MNTKPPQFTIVIPTRNRATLACAALESVLLQAPGNIRIVVSDNSTDAGEAEHLSRHCAGLGGGHLRYIRPPVPFSMTRHWQWALEQVLLEEMGAATHVIYLTDRMIFRNGALPPLLEIAARHPAHVLTYNMDSVDDYAVPARLKQSRWSGALLELDPAHLLAMSARLEFHRCLPTMLNTVVPRPVLERLQERFGSVFDSNSPDFCFACRCLDTVDTLLHWDRPVLVHYAQDRSNGASYARGIPSPDSEDFRRNLGGATMNAASPLPACLGFANAFVHEYCLVQEQTRSPRFPPLDMPRYLRHLRWDAEAVLDPGIKSEMMRQIVEAADALRRKGVNVELDLTPPSVRERLARLARRPRLLLDRVRLEAGALRRLFHHFLWRACRAVPPADCDVTLEFNSTAEALDHANRRPRGRVDDVTHLAPLGGRILEP